MKSIIEQASSIMKAIEKAWDQAENPKEFSIKIFEKEERNFFGMSTKPAKVGIFFTDKPVIHEKQPQKPRPEIKECRPEPKKDNKPAPRPANQTAPVAPKPQQPRVEQPRPENPRTAPAQPQQKPAQQRVQTNSPVSTQTTDEALRSASEVGADKPRRTPAAWNDTMINTTHTWLKKTLALMGMNSIDFSSEVAGKNLKLTFNMPLITDPMHEKQLFRSFAHLIMSSLRNQYKQEIKDLKVILIRPE